MRSSGSTPSLPERPILLGIVLVGDDHPRKCTGRRLVRLGLARELKPPLGPGARPVVLDPYATVPLTSADRTRAESEGLVAVDCSWNQLSARHARGLPRTGTVRGGVGRRLPILFASNPQHYGRLGELNTAEALAAALYVLGRPEEADHLLAGFAGGAAFRELNGERLARYARAASPAELIVAERGEFAGR
jgi:pre-rRNA-processing protein TSR3